MTGRDVSLYCLACEAGLVPELTTPETQHTCGIPIGSPAGSLVEGTAPADIEACSARGGGPHCPCWTHGVACCDCRVSPIEQAAPTLENAYVSRSTGPMTWHRTPAAVAIDALIGPDADLSATDEALRLLSPDDRATLILKLEKAIEAREAAPAVDPVQQARLSLRELAQQAWAEADALETERLAMEEAFRVKERAAYVRARIAENKAQEAEKAAGGGK